MKIVEIYYFTSKSDMSAWLMETAEIENSLDFELYIHNNTSNSGIKLYISEFSTYFPDTNSADWPEDAKYTVII